MTSKSAEKSPFQRRWPSIVTLSGFEKSIISGESQTVTFSAPHRTDIEFPGVVLALISSARTPEDGGHWAGSTIVRTGARDISIHQKKLSHGRIETASTEFGKKDLVFRPIQSKIR